MHHRVTAELRSNVVVIERGDDLVKGMVVEHFLRDTQGWRWRTLLNLKAIDFRCALLLQPCFRRLELVIHPRLDAIERLLRHRHRSLLHRGLRIFHSPWATAPTTQQVHTLGYCSQCPATPRVVRSHGRVLSAGIGGWEVWGARRASGA